MGTTESTQWNCEMHYLKPDVHRNQIRATTPQYNEKPQPHSARGLLNSIFDICAKGIILEPSSPTTATNGPD